MFTPKKLIWASFKSLFKVLIYLDVLRIFRFLYRNKVIILFYHGVSDSPAGEPNNADGKHVDVGKFEQQMRYIRSKYNPVSLKDAVALLKQETKGPPNAIAITFDDGYRNNLEFAYPVIKKYNLPVTIFITTDYIDKNGSNMFLGWDDVSRLHKSGVDFGAHGLSHSHLNKLSDPEAINEVAASASLIGSHINDKVNSFSYPYGSFNENTKRAVKNAGYTSALSTLYGSNSCRSDLYELRRIPVNNNLSFTFFVASLFPFLGRMASSFYSGIKE